PSYRTRMAAVRVANGRQRVERLRDSDLERKAVRLRAYSIEQAVKRRGAFVVGIELRGYARSAFVRPASDAACWQIDTRVRRATVVSQCANDIAGLHQDDAARGGAPDPAATPPLRVAALDASDAVDVLHQRVQHRGRPAVGEETRERHRKFDVPVH